MSFETLKMDPTAQVQAIRAQVEVMGFNDSESADFDRIMSKLQDGDYDDPNEAIKEAQAILDSKQDYH